MSIIYLYIKQHKITKLKYFGKTEKKNPEKYAGSGKYWKRHIKQHGKLIETLCIWEFDNQEECTQFALKFSQENNIVESKEWANLREENGIDGNPIGYTPSIEAKLKMSTSRKGKVPWNTGISLSKSHKEKLSKATKGVSLSKERKEKRFGLGNPFFGKKHSSKTLKLQSEKKKGENNPMSGKKHSPESKEKMRLAKLGSKNPNFHLKRKDKDRVSSVLQDAYHDQTDESLQQA